MAEGLEHNLVPRSLVLSEERGIPIRFEVTLPPNLASSAPRDRIIVRLECRMPNGSAVLADRLDRGKAYRISPSHAKVAVLVESWCGGRLHGNLQLTRLQLLQILESLAEEAVFWWANEREKAPIPWLDRALSGVHPLLVQPVEAPSAPGRSTQTTAKRAETVLSDVPNPTHPVSLASRPSGFASKEPLEVDGSLHYLALRLPSRHDPRHLPVAELLRSQGFVLEPSNGRWWLRDSHKALNFLADHYERLTREWEAVFTEGFLKRMPRLQALEIVAEVEPSGDAFELKLSLSGVKDPLLLENQVLRGKRYLEHEGVLHLIQPRKWEEFEALGKTLTGDLRQAARGTLQLRVRTEQLAMMEESLDTASVAWERPEAWRQRTDALRQVGKLQEAPVPDDLAQQLRIYQKIGVAWMFHLYRYGLGGILADEMGLGKTVQALALLRALKPESPKSCLVICPAGLVTNWHREAKRFAPDLRVYAHYGADRKQGEDDWAGRWDLVITSYSTLVRDAVFFQTQQFQLVIADEAQHIKNRRTQHARALRSLHAQGRFLLTGTPIENSIEDLVSLFEFLMPGYLKLPGAEVSGREDRSWIQERIRKQCAPYILRRRKTQVAPELPPKLEQVLYCQMEPRQKQLYEQVRRDSLAQLDSLAMRGANAGQMKLAAFTELLRLRQTCADPRILKPDLEADCSAKLLAFLELLDEAMDGGHRMLVFSQFVSLLTLLRAELEARGIPYAYLDGSTRNRMAEVDRFQQQEDIPVFLLSLKAGGTGLNLTGADLVVHYDPWWNPAVEAQATDRAHRIGQSRQVTSVKLIVEDSVEARVMDLQASKRKLLDDLFSESSGSLESLGLDDLRGLLE